jgi:hypothetical protein
MTLRIDSLPALVFGLLLPGMKLRNPSRSPGPLFADVPVMEELGIGYQTLEKPVRQTLCNSDEPLKQPSSDLSSVH